MARPTGGRLPDLQALARGVRGMGFGATLRGVEASIEGTLAVCDGELRLRIAGTGEVVRLVALRHKVQWDVVKQREQRPTSAERAAHAGLWRLAMEGVRTVRVTGRLQETCDGPPLRLEVRQFMYDRVVKRDRSPGPGNRSQIP